MESTAGRGKPADVWIGGHLLGVMDEYSPPGAKTPPGLLEDATFVYQTDSGFTWAEAIGGNKARRRLLEPVGTWSYVGYGRVLEVMPVLVDFGLLQMPDANWTSDEDLVGRYVRIPIDRLSLKRLDPPDWPAGVG